jgi:preprotein translocase subunit SecG
MTSLVIILILLACVALAFFILIQNPKGGGLAGSFGNISSQVMGVKQSTDVMEKGTWILISTVAGLCIITVALLKSPEGSVKNGNAAQQNSAPAKKK